MTLPNIEGAGGDEGISDDDGKDSWPMPRRSSDKSVRTLDLIEILSEISEPDDSFEPGDYLCMGVCTATCSSNGEFDWGPRFDLEPGRAYADGSCDWHVAHLGQDSKLIARATVRRHTFKKEPLLCLAARAAWSLWSQRSSVLNTVAYKRLAIEMTYGDDLTAAITVTVDGRGRAYSGFSFPEGVGIALTTNDRLGLHNLEHWICGVLNKVSFGSIRPSRGRAKYERRRGLPSCWSKGNLPLSASQHRDVCLIDYWGGPRIPFDFDRF